MRKRRSRNRVDATGRSTTSRFVRLDHRLLNSNAYRSLSPNARSLLVELVMLYNGENNGSLYLSVRDAAHRLGVADLTATSRAFDDLVALGFLELTQAGHFCVKAAEASRARCWRITWEAGPGRKAPSWDLMEREPEPRSQARRRMERGLRALKAYRKAKDRGRLPVLDIDTLSPFRPELPTAAVLESDPTTAGFGSFPPNDRVRESATHIATPWGEGATNGLIGWWQPDWSPSVGRLFFAASLASISLAVAGHRRTAA